MRRRRHLPRRRGQGAKRRPGRGARCAGNFTATQTTGTEYSRYCQVLVGTLGNTLRYECLRVGLRRLRSRARRTKTSSYHASTPTLHYKVHDCTTLPHLYSISISPQTLSRYTNKGEFHFIPQSSFASRPAPSAKCPTLPRTMKSLAPLRRLCPTKSSSTAPRLSLPLLSPSVKPHHPSNLHPIATHRQLIRHYAASSPKMSNSFSNADTGSKPADPYKAKNLDETSLKEKVEDLVTFIEACKFGMMTTHESSGLLVSRCMALAAKVVLIPLHLSWILLLIRSFHHCRKAVVSISFSTPTPNRARLTIFTMTPKSTLLSWIQLASGPLFQAKPQS